jgi:hypothetical protein
MENNIIEQQMLQLGDLQNPVNRSATPIDPNTNLVFPNPNPVNHLASPSISPINHNYQPPLNKNQPPLIKNQQLSEQGQQAKCELEILAATGKSKYLTGKILTFQDLDYMSEQDILKFYRMYQTNVAVRATDACCFQLKMKKNFMMI